MSHFVNVDRDTPMLLPPDLRGWVADDDPVLFVIEAIEKMNLSFHINRRGTAAGSIRSRLMIILVMML